MALRSRRTTEVCISGSGFMTFADRLLSKIDVTSIGTGCWVWTGGTNAKGYGYIRTSGRGSPMETAHRATYEMMRGEVPDGLHLDHLCRNPRCCNPDHLEPVTRAENKLRARKAVPHCVRGHYFTPENTGFDGTKRYCRACHNTNYTRWYHERGGKEYRAELRAEGSQQRRELVVWPKRHVRTVTS